MPKSGLVQPKPETGATGSSTIAVPQTAYEKVRVVEIESRAELYRLRVAKIRGNLLDREIVAHEFGAMLSVIKSVILQSRLSKSEKADLFANLCAIGSGFVNNVAQTQKAEAAKEDESEAANTKGGIDGFE